MRKTGLNGYVYDFSVDYDAIAVDDILDIYKYLIKKNNLIYIMFRIVKIVFVVAISFFNCIALNCVSMNNKTVK